MAARGESKGAIVAGPGRDTKYNPERRASILTDLAAGLTRVCASERAGIADRTLRRWLAKAPTDPELMSFLSAIKRAERDAEARNVRLILAAAEGGQALDRRTTTRTRRDGTVETEVTERFAQGQWTAAAWWLERKFPEAWGKDAELLREVIAEYRTRKRGGPNV